MLHSEQSIILSAPYKIHCKGQPLVLSRPQEPECHFSSLHTNISKEGNFIGLFTLLACSRSFTWTVWSNYHLIQNLPARPFIMLRNVLSPKQIGFILESQKAFGLLASRIPLFMRSMIQITSSGKFPPAGTGPSIFSIIWSIHEILKQQWNVKHMR